MLAIRSQLISAVPYPDSPPGSPAALPNVPKDTAHLAYDDHTRRYFAYKRDGTLLGTFSSKTARTAYKREDAGGCGDLQAKDATKR
jgi:hypothetical protein